MIMKYVIGITLIVIGVSFGLYIGLYVMFIGGILNIVDFFQNDLSNSILAWGIAKICLSYLTGYLSALVFIIPGWAIMEAT